jgi:hypothetical protein
VLIKALLLKEADKIVHFFIWEVDFSIDRRKACQSDSG